MIPPGNFNMGSSSAEKSWAASQVGSAEGVADEAPQHEVSVSSFAMGKYDVTRGEYAAFVRETGHSDGDGCRKDSYEWKKQADKSWQNPGFHQTDRDPVVCVSRQDAKAYIAWLNGKVRQKPSASGEGFIVTNMTLSSRAVVRFYNKRGTAERWIKEGKQVTHWTRLSCHRFRANEARLQLSLLAQLGQPVAPTRDAEEDRRLVAD